jgi:hypothetical protein
MILIFISNLYLFKNITNFTLKVYILSITDKWCSKWEGYLNSFPQKNR